MTYTQTRDYSEQVAAEIDAEVRKIIDEAYTTCEKLLAEHRPQLDRVAQALIEKEKLSGEEFEALFAGSDESAAGEGASDSNEDVHTDEQTEI